MRTFLILARYATRTVFEEEMDAIAQEGGLFFRPRNLWRLVKAWTAYLRVELKLQIYEAWTRLGFAAA